MQRFQARQQRLGKWQYGLVVLFLALLMGVSGLVAPTLTASGPSFIDPTATRLFPGNMTIGHLVYVGPFAALIAGPSHRQSLTIGDESDIQDNATVNALGGSVRLGHKVILAHGATVKGPALLGETGVCPVVHDVCPTFVGFNAEVEGATLEKDTMVLHLARVARGVTIPSGRKVLPGKHVRSNAEVLAKTAPLTEGDRIFMDGVIEVNTSFAAGYSELANDHPTNVSGINYDPGNSAFNPNRDLPTLNGVATRAPGFRNRIIGDVRLADDLFRLRQVMDRHISLRADEGEAFVVGTIAAMDRSTTFHALEHSHLHLGNNGRYGFRSIVHGGATVFDDAPHEHDTTITGNNVRLGNYSVFFRSRAGNNVKIGDKTLVQDSDLPADTIIGDRSIIIGGVVAGQVEW